uniref:Immunoglobulin C1-set domain-containing protein n=1 Tax=Neogobius melanostomus TaxID=47308 RepID=A0A8C6T7R2_9GOBI
MIHIFKLSFRALKVFTKIVYRDIFLPPKVELYSRGPGEFSNPNILICHVSEFHRPGHHLELLMDGKVLPKANQTDLAFEENWYYHLTKHAHFIPRKAASTAQLDNLCNLKK